MMNRYNSSYLQYLETESIHILRETASEFKNPVLFYSIGKDSSVLLHLAQKAFYPGRIPFTLLHIDTGYEFSELLDFRDQVVLKNQLNLIVHQNTEARAQSLGPELSHTDLYVYYKKTKPLLEAVQKYGFDAGIGGARREEEKSRAKERVFSVRDGMGAWDPKNQRPELWNLYNTHLQTGQTMRVFPLSNWTEVDIWSYIHYEGIEISDLYFAKERSLVKRNGLLIAVDNHTQPNPEEPLIHAMVRYRTLGCAPSTGAHESSATTVLEIMDEVLNARYSERSGRGLDKTSENSMEQKKKEGHF